MKNQRNYCSAAYKAMDKAMERAWVIMLDTCVGALHLRDQGSRYLPIEPAEDTRDFEIRRSWVREEPRFATLLDETKALLN